MLIDDTTEPTVPLSRQDRRAIALGRWAADDGIPPFVYSDGGSGIRDAEGATAFPSPLALAAAFDRGLAREFGRALGLECRAAGRNVLLGPVLDVARTPWGGRVGEGLGEDPELTATLGVEIVTGLREVGVLAIAKHLVANNAELGRTGHGAFGERTSAVDVVIDDRTLHEVYLEPFRRAVVDGGLMGIMGSYNKLNGEYVCQSPDLWRLVRDEWNFTGVTVPDFLFAVRDDAAALAAGMDLPGLGDPHGRTDEMLDNLTGPALAAIAQHVHDAARSVELAPAGPARSDDLHSAATLELAERMVAAGATLLKNEAALPLVAGARVLVVAPPSIDHLLTIGGSAAVPAPHDRTPDLITELRSQGFSVDTLEVTAGDRPARATLTGQVDAHITDATGRSHRKLERFELTADDVDSPSWAAELTTTLRSSTDRSVRLTVEFAGEATVSVDGVTRAAGFREASPMIAGPAYPLHCVVQLSAGVDTQLSVAYSTGPAITVPGTPVRPHLVLGVEHLDDLDVISHKAAEADAVIVLVGRASGEAMDVESLRLPEDQERLIAAVTQAQPNTIVVSLGSGPVAMPWRESPACIIHLWQAGERFAPALASILSGAREPGGRLPLTFPESDEQVPLDVAGYPGVNGSFVFGEGREVGYRGYQSRGETPAYRFGFGLGYTSWRMGASDARLVQDVVEVRTSLENTGDREGSTVVQCYIRRPGDTFYALAGFHRQNVAAGEATRVTIRVPLDQLRARVDGRWQTLPGDYEVFVGLESPDSSPGLLVEVR